MLLAMPVGGRNYNNTPALLLACLLVAVAHNSLVRSHLLLSGMRLRALHAEPVHAGQPLRLRLAFEAQGRHERPGLELRLGGAHARFDLARSEEHTSELQSRENLVCRLLLEKKNVL